MLYICMPNCPSSSKTHVLHEMLSAYPMFVCHWFIMLGTTFIHIRISTPTLPHQQNTLSTGHFFTGWLVTGWSNRVWRFESPYMSSCLYHRWSAGVFLRTEGYGRMTHDVGLVYHGTRMQLLSLSLLPFF